MFNPLQHYEFGKGRFKPFHIVVKTDNAGTSVSNQFTIPCTGSGYNYSIKTSDGHNISGATGSTTITFSSAGTYDVKITGDFPRIFFNSTGDRLKLLEIKSWGEIAWTSFENAFNSCSNLIANSVSDVPNLSGVTSFLNAFRLCTSLTTIGGLNNWNMSTVTNLSVMFQGCTLFNQNIGAWNVSSVTNFSSMFSTSGFNNGGSADINTWTLNTSASVTMNSMFLLNTVFNQPIGNWNVSRVTDMTSMFQQTIFNQNISGWSTANVTNMSAMFRQNSAFNQPIGSWNVSAVTNMNNMFRQATSFNQNIGNWNVSACINYQEMFFVASAFNNGGSSDINNWTLNTSGGSNISTLSMFQSCPFNQPIGNWNTVRVTNMTQMFASNSAFNQNIGGWNVSNCTVFTAMFQLATAFNNGGSNTINNWTINTTASTVGMSTMFQQAISFNQPIGNWNTSKVNTMGNMFNTANSFNQNIGGWNVSSVTTFTNMFINNVAFNNGGSSDINNWVINTSSNVNMSAMFQATTNFNQPIGNWNTSRVTTFNAMFRQATAFNQNIGAWDVSLCVDFTNMFLNNSVFNNGGSSDIDNWILSAVSNISMSQMFRNATAFDQPIGNWNVKRVTNFTDFMLVKTHLNYSAANLDSIYNGWSADSPLSTTISISFGTIKYTAGGSAGKAILTGAPNNWTITDGGI